MKEIKFRAWDKSKEKMFSSDLIARIHFNKGLPYAVMLWSGHAFFHNNMVIQQYIGMKDRDGKEIFIGDILRLNNKTYDPDDDLYYEGIAVVKSTAYLGYQIKPINPIPDEWRFDSTSMWHVGEGDTTEIIGNIYEDRHLLDDEK